MDGVTTKNPIHNEFSRNRDQGIQVRLESRTTWRLWNLPVQLLHKEDNSLCHNIIFSLKKYNLGNLSDKLVYLHD